MSHKRILFVLMILVLALLAAILPSASAQEGKTPRTGFRPDAPPYAIRGPYSVGTRDFVLDEGSKRPLNGTIWYPALNPDGAEEAVTYDLGLGEIAPPFNDWYGKAIRDAAPDPANGPYPLLVYSPGWGGTRFYGSFMHEHLASQGFVVISVDHTGNTLADTFSKSPEEVESGRYATMIERPRDVSRQIDYAETLNSGDMAGMIDLEHIGVYGVSFGGYTALMVGGAQLDLVYVSTWCADQPETPAWCGFLDHQSEMAALAGLDAVPEGLWPSLGDPRVDVIVPIVPGGVEFGLEGEKGIQVPVMLIASEADTFVVAEQNRRVYESIVGKKTFVWFENANHLLIGGLCPDMWKQFAIYCWDPVWDLDRAHDLYDHFLTAFFLAELKGDVDAAAALAPDAVQFTGITYDTTEF